MSSNRVAGDAARGAVGRDGGRVSRRRYLQTAAAAQAALFGALHGAPAAAQGTGTAAGPLAGLFRIWVSAYFPISGDPMWKDVFDWFQASYPTLRVEIGEGAVRGDAEVLAKITTSVAAGDPEDVLHVGGVFAPDYARQGMLRSLEPYFAVSPALQKSDLWPSWLSDGIYHGEQYTLPFAGDVRVMYFNRTEWQRAGLDTRRPPRTWAELEDVARRLTRRDQNGDIDVLGFNPAVVPWWWWVWQLGGEVIDASGERVLLDRGDAAVRALEFEMRVFNAQGGRDALTKYHVALGATEATAGNPSPVNYNSPFQLGKLATWLNTYSHRSEQFRPQGFRDEQWDYGAIPLPPGGRQINWGGSHAFGIPTLAKNPEAGWAWLEHFSLMENDLRFAVRYDRVPLRPTTATSEAYIRGDAFLAHMAEQAWYRRFLPAVPGLSDILPIWNRPVAEVYTGQKSARTAVDQVAREMQVALDRANGRVQ